MGSDLEGEVLKEVRGTVGLVSLCPATGIDPDTDRGGLGPWGVISGDLGRISKDAMQLLSIGRAYGESVGEGGGLGGGRQNRGRKATLHGLDRLQGRTSAGCLVQVESKAPRSHCARL